MACVEKLKILKAKTSLAFHNFLTGISGWTNDPNPGDLVFISYHLWFEHSRHTFSHRYTLNFKQFNYNHPIVFVSKLNFQTYSMLLGNLMTLNIISVLSTVVATHS